MNGPGVAHVAAVGAAGDGDPLRIDGRIGAEPVEEGAEVAHRILAQIGPVIQADEPLAVAGGAADVGEEDGDAQFVDQVVVAAHEAGPALALGPTVDVDDQRAGAREAVRIGAVEEARDRLAIKAGDLDQLRLDVAGDVQTAGFTAGPAGDGQGPGIDGKGV